MIEASWVARVQPWRIRQWFRTGALRRYLTPRRALIGQDELLKLVERDYTFDEQSQALIESRKRSRMRKKAASAA